MRFTSVQPKYHMMPKVIPCYICLVQFYQFRCRCDAPHGPGGAGTQSGRQARALLAVAGARVHRRAALPGQRRAHRLPPTHPARDGGGGKRGGAPAGGAVVGGELRGGHGGLPHPGAAGLGPAGATFRGAPAAHRLRPAAARHLGRRAPLHPGTRERLRLYNVSSDFSCCYRRFWRPDGDPKHYSHGVDDAITMAEECVPFESGTDVSGEEFVKVECRSPTNGSVVFRDYHAFVPLKPRVEERVVNLTDVGDDDESFSERPSVLIVGIDAVSRLNFHRQMNGTLAELRRLGAIEMLGYNKVGDNTFPNLVPVLAGMSEAELRNACWPNDKVAFDDCPWLWKTFHAAGYRSAFGEDAPWMGIFSYLKVGFVLQPTDYYLRPYMKLSEDDVGHKKPMNAKLCTGSRLTAEVLLEYVGRLGRALLTCRRRLWALFWGASLSHDILSYPAAGDRLYVRLLRDLERCGALNRTIVVVMSDHGIRWGAIRETYQGRLEERLPMLSVLLPAGFQQRYPAAAANLRRNARRLSTPFDLHRTLLDVAHAPRGLDADSLRVRSRAAAEAAVSADSSQAARGLSLFTELPAARTCASAGVEPHWCTCQESRPVSTDSEEAVRAATFVVTQLNLLLGSHRECARLTLAEVRDARLLVARKSQLDGADGAHAAPVDVLVTLRTSPGDAVFEATVRRRPHEGDMALAGVVSRLNQYGKQSACMTNFRLRLYCYCRTS
ncbi:uncharacterized protein LOC126457087 isoform X1 [Schistocerca serialis cubense]|uniref:uncharacterized protein LOC126457087 isoform X1 n=1 Tax=Schistocerca serialis cubense TaxID=2023355 RepID=UPI00214F20E2|nr:uncharacterized protein LOC126457087 isoform X1 [Schistocerca serialis cubense]